MQDHNSNSCPCCASPLLRHVRHRGVYWFCTSCWQEVPLLAVSKIPSTPKEPATTSKR
ncbi:MAG: hypothetical protein KME01_02915 [Chroococcus sp. CMT-3BRIN-NPC107]|jgi:ribosomal protein L37AE/L43A|nr:hypothetical protein [Chroococcus sp. CMT-3BRIN-NPC107]